MTEAAEKVLEEMRRFWAALPELRKHLEGRWVVFSQGEVVSDHATEDDALQASRDNPGEQQPFVVARVAERKPIPLSAASLYAVDIHV